MDFSLEKVAKDLDNTGREASIEVRNVEEVVKELDNVETGSRTIHNGLEEIEQAMSKVQKEIFVAMKVSEKYKSRPSK